MTDPAAGSSPPDRPPDDRPVAGVPSGAGFLDVAPETDDVRRLFAGDVDDVGYVMNLSLVWAHHPSLQDGIAELMGAATAVGSLTFRQRGVLVSACASTMGDSYCSLAWGNRLADETSPEVAAQVLQGDDAGLDPTERALARWARQVARDPNGTGPGDVQALRDVGFTDEQILGITLYVALRLAFSTVNDALGARPDAGLVASVPPAVAGAVTFGRPPAHDGPGG